MWPINRKTNTQHSSKSKNKWRLLCCPIFRKKKSNKVTPDKEQPLLTPLTPYQKNDDLKPVASDKYPSTKNIRATRKNNPEAIEKHTKKVIKKYEKIKALIINHIKMAKENGHANISVPCVYDREDYSEVIPIKFLKNPDQVKAKIELFLPQKYHIKDGYASNTLKEKLNDYIQEIIDCTNKPTQKKQKTTNSSFKKLCKKPH